MTILVFLFTLIFIVIALISSSANITNSLFGYFIIEFEFIFQTFLSFVVVLLSIIFLARSAHFEKHLPLSSRLYASTIQTFQIIILGLLLGFLTLFVIAFIQLNFFAILMNINPKLLGVVTDKKIIFANIKNNDQPPNIVASDPSQNKELNAIAVATTGSTNFYGSYVLESIPGFLVLPVSSPTSMAMIDNTLIFTKINPGDLQEISPLIGSLFLRQYFWDRKIKSFPNLDVMTKQEFIKYRQADAYKKSLLVVGDIQKIEDAISSTSAAIQQDQVSIDDSQNNIKLYYSQRDSEYSKCLSAGFYNSGIFQKTNTSDDCKYILDQWNTKIDQTNSQADSLSKKILTDQNNLSTYKVYDSVFKSQGQIVNIQKAGISNELGVFAPPTSIKIVINSDSSHIIADYFETLSHEYLHYASYNPSKSFSNPFFEEGLTEYFARNIIHDEMGVDVNIGYPVQVKIISAMTKVIPEARLAEIYFTKDETALEQELDHAYGDGFYQNNSFTFEVIQYSNNATQALQLTNKIMKLIGGTPLKEKDLYSTPTDL